jgi:hypothetical protein
MSVGKARAYSKAEAVALPTNIKLSWKRLTRDKHSSLLHTFVNYGRKKFDKIGPWWLSK